MTRSQQLEQIPFNVPTVTGAELENIRLVFEKGRFSGKGPFATLCREWFEERYDCAGTFITPSCTHALEAAAMLTGVGPGDEVILPSFAFTSTATAFARCGARLVFVDIQPETMNIDPARVEAAITDKTKAIVALHYAGVACEMDTLLELAKAHRLWLVEDAAQAVLCTYKGRLCGDFGDFGCFSFHETKNLQCGEGGALLVRDADMIGGAEVVQEKGSNRSRFVRGEVDKYNWVELGSSYTINEFAAAALYTQLTRAEDIISQRLKIWDFYYESLAPLAAKERIELAEVPEYCTHNAHIAYVKLADESTRDRLIDHLKGQGIQAVFHYVPLHSSPAGMKYGRFDGEDRWTNRESSRLLRLPLFHGMSEDQAARVVTAIHEFYTQNW